MTRALAAAARTALPEMHVAGKGIDCGDKYGRHEYLTMDLTVYDDNKWECPTLIVEHENSPSGAKLQYCAWKLLSVYAKARILVAYIDTTGRYAWCKNSAAELRTVLLPVLAAHPDKPLALFVGDWCAELGENGFKGVFSNIAIAPG